MIGDLSWLGPLMVAMAMAACTVWILGGLCAVRIVTGRRRLRSASGSAPITVLKPLCGADRSLEKNLESFFRQDHPDFQLIFGLESALDPALGVVRVLQRRYPRVDVSVVFTAGARGLNPKVRNLRGMVGSAKHDLILISDSNIAAQPDYLRDMVSAFEPSDVGLVTSVVAGIGAEGWGAQLDAVQLNGFVAAGATLPTAVGHPAVLGKSMLMSRRQFEKLGGLGSVADVLAEDFIIGKCFQRAGYRVVTGRSVLLNVTDGTTVAGFFQRHVRWSMMRSRLRPWAYAIEPLTSPTALLGFAWMCIGPAALGWWAAMVLLRDLGGWLLLRGPVDFHWPVLLALPREILTLAIWAVTPFVQHVEWRGHRLRVRQGTRLSPLVERPRLSLSPSSRAACGNGASS